MLSVFSRSGVTEIRITLLPEISVPLLYPQKKKTTEHMKCLFSRHWKLGSKGQQTVGGEKQTRRALPLATDFRVSRLGTRREI